MKSIFAAVLLALVGPAWSQEAPTALEFIGEAVKHAEADTAFNLNGDKFGAAYFSIRTLNVPFPNIIDAGVGAIFGAGKPEGLVSVRLNLPQLVNGIFGTQWFTKVTSGPVLPTLFIGPAIKADFPFQQWTWKKDVFLLIGLPLGALGK